MSTETAAAATAAEEAQVLVRSDQQQAKAATTIDPLGFLLNENSAATSDGDSAGSPPKDVIFVILNQDWSSMRDTKSPLFERFQQLWNRSALRVCVDGGLSTLHRINELVKPQSQAFIPDLITGDFDSTEARLLDIYRGLGVKVKYTPDQVIQL